ncbi:DUF1566 domain-containing protein [Psychromonas sp. Urea-02u-13]|uniref:DUF1566 domain-containing protein n=1 Tax=Psychromonas sp. Urea-02u-13 TaxID=2058326 RepID=UPI000C320FF1|nr:DUF1566 domain-containing protein [Psychromonas sp. Urea-02u-13]PKG40156.1 hypothetical protein CXF74_04910 [Psychromonas sp. Urea-02u-13]
MNKLTLILPFALISQVVFAEVAPVLVPECYEGTSALDQTGRFENTILPTDDGDFKVVNDLATGLQWAYCPYGQTVTAEGACSGSQHLLSGNWKTNYPLEVSKIINKENTRLGEYAQPWRAPNFNEAMSIYNKDCTPNIYTNFYYSQLSQATLDEMLALRIADNHQYKMWWVLSNLFIFATETQSKDAKKIHSINYGYSTGVLGNQSGGNVRLVREIPSE